MFCIWLLNVIFVECVSDEKKTNDHVSFIGNNINIRVHRMEIVIQAEYSRDKLLDFISFIAIATHES